MKRHITMGPIQDIFLGPSPRNWRTTVHSSDSFAHTLRYVVNVENCRNYIEMYQCPPITERRS